MITYFTPSQWLQDIVLLLQIPEKRTSSFSLDLPQPRDWMSIDIEFSSPTPLPTWWMGRNKVPDWNPTWLKVIQHFPVCKKCCSERINDGGADVLKFGGGHRAKECFYHLLKVDSCNESMLPLSGTESISPELALCSYSTLHLNQNIHF